MLRSLLHSSTGKNERGHQLSTESQSIITPPSTPFIIPSPPTVGPHAVTAYPSSSQSPSNIPSTQLLSKVSLTVISALGRSLLLRQNGCETNMSALARLQPEIVIKSARDALEPFSLTPLDVEMMIEQQRNATLYISRRQQHLGTLETKRLHLLEQNRDGHDGTCGRRQSRLTEL